MKTTAIAAAMFLAASPAFAHADALAHGSLAAGLAHPMLGADHLLSMVAVGILAATASGKGSSAMPAAFVAAMTFGFVLALLGLQMPVVEPVILASVIILGGMVAIASKLSLNGLVALSAAFGMFHGAAHGAEIGAASIAGFAAGMLVATALLCGAGVVLGRVVLSHLHATRAALVLRGLGLGMVAVGASAAFA